MSQINVLITGANRGVGRALAATFLQRPQTSVFALVRDPSNNTSQSLQSLPKGDDSSIMTLQYDAGDSQAAVRAIDILKVQHNIKSLDIVIANAGALTYWGKGADCPAEQLLNNFNVNTISQITLYQAALPLLKALHLAGRSSKFIAISSEVGSIASMKARAASSGSVMQALPYGVAKCALNYAMTILADEDKEVVVQMMTPGRTKTDFAVKVTGQSPTGAVPLEDSVAGLVKLIDAANKETSGKFFNWDGRAIEW